MTRSTRRTVAIAAFATASLLAASCSSGSNDDLATSDATDPPVTLPDYADEALAFEDADDDSSLPPIDPESSTGSYGFSRYVYNEVDGQLMATLIEGPRGEQTRCQDVELDCSYTELKALYDSGDEVPEYLGMDRQTLGELVAQLDETRATVDSFPTIEDACAAGFAVSSAQNANMGIHAYNPGGTTAEFDPARPQMVLFAKDGGEKLTREEQGSCVDGAWTGEPGYESVGAVFTQLMSEEHPPGFAGPIDNWHIHFNTCAGSSQEGGVNRATDAEVDADTRNAFSKERCEANGGSFRDVIPTWMMHAYVDPEHDPQGGVFAMFNPNIWPVVNTPDGIEELRTAEIEGATAAPINNFDFGSIEVGVGEEIAFSNSDSVPHTVTAGSPTDPSGDFDSGVFGTGQVYRQTFDDAGEYAIFCVLHPQMQGTVVVSD